MPGRRALLVALLSIVSLAAPVAAHAATGDPLGIACQAQSDGGRFCEGSAASLEASDGQKILDGNVTLPPAPASGTDGNYPLVIVGHGYGGAKKDYATREEPYIPSAQEWAAKGYAVLNISDRGFGGSCGKAAYPAHAADCTNGYIRLLDARYEVRDVQALAGKLADQGWIDPQRIGAVGESYGGGLSIMLATLRNRVMNADGSLSPWTSPDGKAMRIAGAAPSIPWTSLVSSLVPNGRGLDYALTGRSELFTPPGIEKQSFVTGLYASGAASGMYALPGQNDQADLTTWFARINAGEPYTSPTDPNTPDATIGPILQQFVRYRDSFDLLNGAADPAGDDQAPAPLLIANGWTDDLFPVDENVRYYNLVKARFPSTPIALVDMDFGHMRGANKAADLAYLYGRTVAWIDHHVKGTADDTGPEVAALTQTCPKTAPSAGPITATSWAALAPGQVAFASSPTQNVVAHGGNPANAAAFDPVASQGNACATVKNDSEPGSALYTLPAATGAGYTLLGSPTITAKLAVTGTFPSVVGRLLDVAPDGTRTLVARGIYRPAATDSEGTVFQLHPGAWHFDAGHRPELELLPQDPPYARISNGVFTVGVSNLRLVLPTRETSGSGTTAKQPLPLPAGAAAAPGAATTPLVVASGGAAGGKLAVRLTRPALYAHQPRRRYIVETRVRGAVAGARGRGCAGTATVTVSFGGKKAKARRVGVTAKCKYRTSLVFSTKKLGRRNRSRTRKVAVRVTVAYGGNARLKAATTSRAVTVRRR